MANQLIGKILFIKPTEAIPTSKGDQFYKRELILDCTKYDPITGERSKNENTPMIEFTGDRCALLDHFAPGQVVVVSFDLQGSKGTTNDRYFNSVRGYRIELRDTPKPITAQPQTTQKTKTEPAQSTPKQQTLPGTKVPPIDNLPW